MTFSAILKKDLSRLPFGAHAAMLAELSGIIGAMGTITVISPEKGGNGSGTGSAKKMTGMKDVTPVLRPGYELMLKTEHPAVASRGYQLFKKLFRYKGKITIEKTKKFREHRFYTVEITDSRMAEKILTETGILSHNAQKQAFFANQIPERFGRGNELSRAYIRGVFLGCGSITNPEKTYHLELVGKKETNSYLQSIRAVLNEFEIKANLIKRKNNWVLYIKESESVANFLNVIGAHRGLLEMENIRIVKEMRNEVNRQVNCETANLNKTITAAYEQVSDIMVIKEQYGLDKLPKNLYDIAELRLNYPDASIKELGERLDPPVGKSGVYHRLKKLSQLADTLKSK